MNQKGRLIFTGGTYHIQTLSTGNNAELIFQDASEVLIADKVETGNRNYIGPEDTMSVFASNIVF